MSMWGKQSSDQHSNPFSTAKLEIKGLENLNPFNKKKKKQKWSIKMVDKSKSKSKSKNTKKSSKKHSTKPKPAYKSKPKSKSSPKKSVSKSKSNHKIKHKTKPKSSINTEHTIQPHIAQQKSKTKPKSKTNPKPNPPRHTHPKQQLHTQTNNSAKTHSSQPPKQVKQPSHSSQPSKPTIAKKKKPSVKRSHNSVQKKTYNAKPMPKKPKSAPTKPVKKTKRVHSSKKTKVAHSKKEQSDTDDSDSETEETKHQKKKKNRQNQQDSEFRARLQADIIDEKPNISFKDVQGLASVKLALYETIILPSLRPELFTGLRSPTAGLLLFGPPGNGKTMIAKCVAAGCDGTFFSISASSITSKFVGDAERIMRTLFDLARERAPSIIFIDEIDSLLTARGGSNEAESSRRIKTEFLIQFDGCKKASDEAKRILVIGATNLPNQLDEAVLRRFGKRIMVPLPDSETRAGLLQLLMAKQKNSLSGEDFEMIVTKTEGYSCSDLNGLCKDASMGPIRDLGSRIIEIQNLSDMPFIELKHFSDALGNVKPSLPQSSLKYFDEWNDKFGSKIHLSMNALPDNMKPYTTQELEKIQSDGNDEESSDSY